MGSPIRPDIFESYYIACFEQMFLHQIVCLEGKKTKEISLHMKVNMS